MNHYEPKIYLLYDYSAGFIKLIMPIGQFYWTQHDIQNEYPYVRVCGFPSGPLT